MANAKAKGAATEASGASRVTSTPAGRRNPAYLELLIDSMEDALLVVDRNLRVIKANSSFLRLVASSEADVVGRVCWKVIGGDSKRCALVRDGCPSRRVFETGKAAEATLSLRFQGRAPHLFHIRSCPIFSENSQVDQAIEVFRDLTGSLPAGNRPGAARSVVALSDQAAVACSDPARPGNAEMKGGNPWPSASGLASIVGRSPALCRVLEMIDRVAQTDSTVLIQGESGVGKELVARATHARSLRRKAPFVVVDCGSLHENILQSELFGHEKGAYTGAVNLKHGLFEIADTGTLFLDEVSALHPAIQTNLLRVLEFGTFRRVGGTDDIRVDVRVLASTNRDLEKLIEAGQFREDLYFRLNVVKIFVPPLRERKEDIPLLVEHFLSQPRLATCGQKKISAEALELLVRYDWPGNIRELENVIERATILSRSEVIQPEDLPIDVESPTGLRFRSFEGGWLPLRELELNYIQAVLRSTGGNKLRAARILGIDRKTLHAKLKKMKSSSGTRMG